MRESLRRFGGREVKTLGDGFLLTFDGRLARSAVRGPWSTSSQELGVRVRVGLHTGECEAMGDDLGGIAVHIAARVSALAEPSEVLVSRTVKDLVAGSNLTFSERGTHSLKGLPEEWSLYAVTTSS